MKPLTKLYFKTFLLMGIPFGLLVTASELAEGAGINLWKLLFTSCFFGITMSLGLVSIHRYQLKKKGVQEMTSENLKVNQTKTLKSELPKKALVDKLKSDPIFGKMKFSESGDGIVINSGMSWKSWGEEIKIKMGSSEGHQNEYQISSSPKLKTTLVDFGRNLKHVNRIESIVKNVA